MRFQPIERPDRGGRVLVLSSGRGWRFGAGVKPRAFCYGSLVYVQHREPRACGVTAGGQVSWLGCLFFLKSFLVKAVVGEC